MSEHKIKNGSFRVRIPTINNLLNENNNKLQCTDPKNISLNWTDSNVYTVQMLSQNEYSNDWMQVVPKKRTFLKFYKDENNVEQVRISSNVFKMKINLAQLPYHLWNRLKLYKSMNVIRNGMYQYLVEPTNVDNEIQELVNIVQKPVDKELYNQRVGELLNILKENDIYGWVVIKASRLYNYN